MYKTFEGENKMLGLFVISSLMIAGGMIYWEASDEDQVAERDPEAEYDQPQPLEPGTSVGVELLGGPEDDEIFGSSFDDTLLGGDGDDTLIGNEGSDRLEGGAGNDELRAFPLFENHQGSATSGTSNTLLGGEGSDSLWGAEQHDDYLDGGDGNDFISGGDYSNDTLIGGGGHDTISGGAIEDWIDAGDGDDFVRGNEQNDTIYGRAGNDTIIAGINGLQVADSDCDEVHGGAGDDLIVGVGWSDTIFGGDGNDTISGGHQNDYVDAGSGDDEIIIEKYQTHPDTRSGLLEWSGGDTVSGGEGQDTFTIFDNSKLFEDSFNFPSVPVENAAVITDFDQEEDLLVYKVLTDDEGDVEVDIVDWDDGTGADLFVNGEVVARVTGAAGLQPTDVLVVFEPVPESFYYRVYGLPGSLFGQIVT